MSFFLLLKIRLRQVGSSFHVGSCISCSTRDFYFQCLTVMRDAFVEKMFWAVSPTLRRTVFVHSYSHPLNVAGSSSVEVENICFSACLCFHLFSLFFGSVIICRHGKVKYSSGLLRNSFCRTSEPFLCIHVGKTKAAASKSSHVSS